MRASDKQEQLEVMPVVMDDPTGLATSSDDEIREAEADEPKAVTIQAMPSRDEALAHEVTRLPPQEMVLPLRAWQRA